MVNKEVRGWVGEIVNAYKMYVINCKHFCVSQSDSRKSYCARGLKTLKISDRSLGGGIVCLLYVRIDFIRVQALSQF